MLDGTGEGKSWLELLAFGRLSWSSLLTQDLGQVSSHFPSALTGASCGSPLRGGHAEQVGKHFHFIGHYLLAQ